MGIPSVLTLIGWDIFDPHYSAHGLLQIPMRTVMKNCNSITTISSFVKDVTVRKFGIAEEKIKVIPSGVNTEMFHPSCNGAEIREKYHIKDNELLVLTVQRLVPRKAGQYFIKAIPRILHSEDHMKFIMVGDGPEEDKLLALARKLGVDDRLIIATSIPRVMIPSFYAACDIFAFHTLHEGLGLVLLEAIASGKPVVTTVAGGTTDIVKDGVNGLLVKPRDVQAFAKAVLILAKNEKLRKKMGKKGRKIAEDTFDWTKIAEKYINVYSSVVK